MLKRIIYYISIYFDYITKKITKSELIFYKIMVNMEYSHVPNISFGVFGDTDEYCFIYNRKNNHLYLDYDMVIKPFIIADNTMNKQEAADFMIGVSGGSDTGKIENKIIKFIKQTNIWKLFNKLPKTIEHSIVEEEIPELSVEEFFSSIKNNTEELKVIKDRAEGYVKALEKLKSLGQVSLYESMTVEIEVHRAEAQLDSIGMNKYISENSIVEFIKKSDKYLRLDWIKNFTRMIPDEVANKKFKADELQIFDNYVVLHYDPENKSNQLTAEEKEKMADPILFGVLIGSKKLYYVGDWIDEYCDLTLDQVIKHLGESHIKNV